MVDKVLEGISANVSTNNAKRIVEQKYKLIVNEIQKLDGYDDLNFHLLPPVISKDNTIEPWPHGYTLKIINWRDSNDVNFFTEYINILLYLAKEGVSCPCPVKNAENNYLSYLTNFEEQLAEDELKPRRHIILLLTYVPGENVEKIGYNEKIIFSLGFFLSQLHYKLQPFNDSKVLQRPNFIWSLMSVPNIENLLDIIPDEENRMLVIQHIQNFKKMVILKIDSLEKGVIHGDINYGNILVQKLNTSEGNDYKISGIIDFTDMHISCYFFDVALAACYLGLAHVEYSMDAIALFLLGYQKRPFTDYEFQFLKVCICARLCQSIVLGLQSLISNPNNYYVKNSTSQLYGWDFLKNLSKMSDEEFNANLHQKMNNFRCKYSTAEL